MVFHFGTQEFVGIFSLFVGYDSRKRPKALKAGCHVYPHKQRPLADTERSKVCLEKQSDKMTYSGL